MHRQDKAEHISAWEKVQADWSRAGHLARVGGRSAADCTCDLTCSSRVTSLLQRPTIHPLYDVSLLEVECPILAEGRL